MIHHLRIGSLALIAGLALAFAACGTSSVGISPTATATSIPATPTTSVTHGAQPCPAGATPAFYGGLIGLDVSSHVQSVTCADLKNDHQLEALVLVRLDGTGGYLDWYIYSMPAGGTATRLFFRRGLGGGDAQISQQNSVVVKSVDTADCVNIHATSNAELQPSWSQEIAWNGTAFAPTVFPGFYPFFTRYDAMQAQAEVTAGHATAATPVAEINDFFTHGLGYAAPDGATALASSDATHAAVTSFGFTLHLERLIQTDSAGIWDIVSIDAQPHLALSVPAALASVISTISLAGTGSAFEGQFDAVIKDHANCRIGQHTITGPSGSTAGPFTGAVTYTADSGVAVNGPEGTLVGTQFQEGAVWIFEQSAKGDGTYVTLQIVKVLLG